MRNLPSFLALQAVTILRFYTMYRPLRVFMTAGAALIGVALLLGLRFLALYAAGRGAGHVQSLILAAIFEHRRVPGGVDRADRGSGESESEDDGGDVVSGAARAITSAILR